MLLLIDVGNTNVVFAIYKDNSIITTWRIATNYNTTADEYILFISNYISKSYLNIAEIDSIAVSSVVPQLDNSINALCNYINSKILYFNPAVHKYNINIKNNINFIGSDRIANMIGASNRYELPIMVLDFGTATTIDLIDENYTYMGGCILPGPNTFAHSLHHYTSQLPLMSFKATENVIADHCLPAMSSGIYWGYIEMIKGLIIKISQQYNLNNNITLVATGGLLSTFCNQIDIIQHKNNNLIFYGLADLVLYNHNQK